MSPIPSTLPANEDSPLAEFAGSHRNIVSQLDTLGELPALLEPAARARRIAQEALAFFRPAIFDHHADEEKDLFPAVLDASAPGDEADTVRGLVQALTREHRAIEALWALLEPQLQKVADGQPGEVDAAAIQVLVRNYAAHARLEEGKFLPLCGKILGRADPELAELGLSLHMRHAFRDYRRGLKAS
jgi:hemerythrin-like domain-containing protein